MPKAEEVARQALADFATDAHVDLAVGWLNHRIQEAAAYGKFRFLRFTKSVMIPAAITQGSVSVTQGHRRVTPDNTAKPLWNQNLVGRMFLARNVWYRIENVTPDHLDLESPFSETTVTGGSYKIVQTLLTLPDFRRIDDVVLPRMRRLPLEIVTAERLNSLAPNRIFNAAGPRFVAAAGVSDNGDMQVELWPYSSLPETLIITGYRIPKRYTNEERLPGAIDEGILKDGIKVDICNYEWAKANRAGQVQQAMLWQQQMTAQEARWRNSRDLLALQDKEIDDSRIEPLGRRMWGRHYRAEIVTAYDEIIARGRP